jgi:hypothetical protein
MPSAPSDGARPGAELELELELIQTQMAQKRMLRAKGHARALRASQNGKRAEVWWAEDAPDGWAGRGRVREWKALVWDGVISDFVWRSPAEVLCSTAQPCCVGGRKREWKALPPR